jgi:hypothetical protein
MKRQVIFIHGGDTYDSYNEYIASLKRTRIDFNRLSSKGWKGTLQKNLGDKFQVILPRFPNSLNAKYLEWEIWFQKLIPHMNKEVILGGNSLGAIFLAKYLSENKFPKTIKGLFLVAPPFDDTCYPSSSLADFNITNSLERLAQLGPKIHLYHSTDDRIVISKDFNRYVKAIPNAKVRIFKDRGHFMGEKFPELVKDMKALYQ